MKRCNGCRIMKIASNAIRRNLSSYDLALCIQHIPNSNKYTSNNRIVIYFSRNLYNLDVCISRVRSLLTIETYTVTQRLRFFHVRFTENDSYWSLCNFDWTVQHDFGFDWSETSLHCEIESGWDLLWPADRNLLTL